LLAWRLAADVLEILRYGNVRRDRWADTRRAAVEAAVEAFSWKCKDAAAPPPVLEETHGRPVEVIHRLANRDDDINCSDTTRTATRRPLTVDRSIEESRDRSRVDHGAGRWVVESGRRLERVTPAEAITAWPPTMPKETPGRSDTDRPEIHND